MKRWVCALLATSICLLALPALAGSTLSYRQLAHQHRAPDSGFEDPKWHALVTNRAELRRAWNRFNMKGDPPSVGFERRVGVFAGTGGSSSCPLYVHDLRLRRSEHKIIVRIANDTGGANACTSDWRASTFLLSVPTRELPRLDALRVRVRHIHPG